MGHMCVRNPQTSGSQQKIAHTNLRWVATGSCCLSLCYRTAVIYATGVQHLECLRQEHMQISKTVVNLLWAPAAIALLRTLQCHSSSHWQADEAVSHPPEAPCTFCSLLGRTACGGPVVSHDNQLMCLVMERQCSCQSDDEWLCQESSSHTP
jgi:hypothetical protein